MVAPCTRLRGGGRPSGTLTITSNGVYDVSKYAEADVNVQDEPVLLWENPSPNSSFEAQTVALNGDEYSGYIVEAKYVSTGDDKYRVRQYFEMGQISRPIFVTPNNITYVYRVASDFTASGITFAKPSGTDSESRNTKYIIPTRIWGVKFTL